MEILKEDIKRCVNRLPKKLFNLMKERKETIFLAGGYIRSCISNEPINDIDLFVSSKDQAELYINLLADDFVIYRTEYAFTILGKKPNIQIIHKWTYAKPEDILPSFDFTIAKSVIWYDGENWIGLCDDRFYMDLAAKRLVYTSPKRIEEVGGSMLRVLKFYQRGYRIPLDSLGAVISRLITGINEDKLLGIIGDTLEEKQSRVITSLLYEVDPNIDPEHVSHLSPLVPEHTERLL